MRSKNSNTGSSMLEVILLSPVAILGIAIATEGSRLFETRVLVAATLRQAILSESGSIMENTPRAVVEELSRGLVSAGTVQIAIVDATLKVDRDTGAAEGLDTIRSAAAGAAFDTPTKLIYRALAPLGTTAPHPFAVTESLSLDAPTHFRDRLAVRIVAIRLTPHTALTPLLARVLGDSMRIETLQTMPLRGRN